MKRFASLLVALVLMLACLSSASAARMVQPFATEYFQIYVPGDWVIDLSSQEDYYGALDLGFAYSAEADMLIEAKLNFYTDWAQDALWTGSKALWEEYEEFLLDDFKEENPEYIGKFMAGKYPGALIKGTNSYGSYLFGEILINAYAYGFYFYLVNEDDTVNSDIQQEDIDFFQSVLETFTSTGIVSTVKE